MPKKAENEPNRHNRDAVKKFDYSKTLSWNEFLTPDTEFRVLFQVHVKYRNRISEFRNYFRKNSGAKKTALLYLKIYCGSPATLPTPVG